MRSQCLAAATAVADSAAAAAARTHSLTFRQTPGGLLSHCKQESWADECARPQDGMAPARCIRAQYRRTVQTQRCFGRTVRAAGAHSCARAVAVRAWQATGGPSPLVSRSGGHRLQGPTQAVDAHITGPQDRMLEHRERVERHEVRGRREQRHGVGVGLAAGLEAA